MTLFLMYAQMLAVWFPDLDMVCAALTAWESWLVYAALRTNDA